MNKIYPKCLCGSSDYKEYFFNNSDVDFGVIKCKKCHLSRTWPIPLSHEEICSYYDEQTDYKDRAEQEDLWKKFTNRTLKIIKKYKEKGKLLEVGCNCGIFIKEALREGFDAHGIDVSSNAIKFGVDKYNLKERLSCGHVKDFQYKENDFDVVTYLHVLEHIEGLRTELKEVNRILKSNGILIIEVPNFESIWRKFLRNRWYGFSPFQHIWQFSKEPLEKILKEEKFVILKTYIRQNMHHEISFSLKGVIKLMLSIYSCIIGSGDNLVIVALKK